jgi:hypothetical protein
MRRAGAILSVTVLAVISAAPADSRLHRLHRPLPELPHSLTVDEKEWSVLPSQTVVAAGVVRFTAYDRGQDAHDMEIIGPQGAIATVMMKSGASARIVETLRPGTYRLICSLYAGTRQSHEARGMHAILTVQ